MSIQAITDEHLGGYVMYDGELMQIIGFGDGRTVILRSMLPPCPTCGHVRDVSLLEHSPLFQDGVKPVKTVELRG